MFDTSYPRTVADVLSTLTEIFRHQKRGEIVDLLHHAHAHFDSIDYDNWNGGTTTWALRLEIPTVLYASAYPRLPDIERELADTLSYLNRLHQNDPLTEVTITPLTSSEVSLGQQIAASESDVQRLWQPEYYRLFLSHVSRYKVHVSKLKTALFSQGVSAFVAHEDIEPSLEWQTEICLALRSMHGLAALVTPDFHGSNWTDQEVGWALGRGVPVIPIRLGADPYGFVGKIQAIPGSLEDPLTLAGSITQTLLRNGQSHVLMRRALVEAFEHVNSFAGAKALKNVIVTVEDFTEEEKDRLRMACNVNSQVSGSWGVPQAIYGTFGPPTQATVGPDDETPF